MNRNLHWTVPLHDLPSTPWAFAVLLSLSAFSLHFVSVPKYLCDEDRKFVRVSEQIDVLPCPGDRYIEERRLFRIWICLRLGRYQL